MAEKDILERHVLELADVLVDVLKLTGILLPGFRAEDLHPLPVLELNATLYSECHTILWTEAVERSENAAGILWSGSLRSLSGPDCE